MNYTHLIFDLDETLLDFKKTERVALSKTMYDYNIPYDETFHLPLYKKINKVLWDNLEKGLIKQEEIKVKRFIDYKEALNAHFSPVDFAESFMNHLGNGSYLLEGAESLINSLAPHYQLIILTNGLTAVQKSRVGGSPIGDCFEHLFISEEIGIAKPNPKLYHHVFEQLQSLDPSVDKSKFLMIGDSLTSDIQGGINAGIDTCWVNLNNNQHTGSVEPTYEVGSLNDLSTLLIDFVNLSEL